MQINMIPISGGGDFYNNTLLMAAIYSAVRDESAEGQRFMQIYPPKETSVTYKRTGTLRRSWSNTVNKKTSSIVGVIGSNQNIAPYNEDVQGEDQLYLFQKLGWQTVDDLAKKVQKELPAMVQNQVDKAFGGL